MFVSLLSSLHSTMQRKHLGAPDLTLRQLRRQLRDVLVEVHCHDCDKHLLLPSCCLNIFLPSFQLSMLVLM
jgi:hypothetical protein